jgi:hypothetical protein
MPRTFLFKLLISIWLRYSCVATPIFRDHSKHHYIAFELSPSSPSEYPLRAQRIASTFGYTLLGRVGELDNYYLFSVEKSKHNGEEEARTIIKRHQSRSHPNIVKAHYQVSRRLHKRGLVENIPSTDEAISSLRIQDPRFKDQWHLVTSAIPLNSAHFLMIYYSKA